MSYQTQDPYEFLHYCNSQDQVITDQNKLFISNLVIYDVRYQINHHQTIIQLFDEQNILSKTLWGLQDVQFQKLENIDEQIKKIIETSTIYSQTLPGGQLFKITFKEEIDAWLIYSNNATIVAKISDDLSEFSFQRFDSAVDVGELWFNYLNQLNEQQILNLKKDLQNRTLYGQILNQQSLVYIPNDTLYFLGIKDLDFETTMQFFTFYGMNHSKVAQFQPQYKIIQKHIERIQRSDIELEMAGVILHYGNNFIIVNTLEYLILKQIQNILLNEPNVEKDLKQFIKQFQYKPIRQYKFYQNILDEAQKIAHQYNQLEFVFKNKFNDFITIILYNLFNNKTFTWNQIKNSNDYRKLWSTYQSDQLQRIPVYQGEQIKNPENVFIIIPVAINGVGISTFARTFQTYYVQTQIITDFHDAKIKDNQVIIIEHNHTPQEAQQIISQSSKFCKKIILYVQTQGSKNKLKVPFSFQVILTALKRQCHSIDKIPFFMKKLKQFENFNYSQIQSDGYIEFPFINEDFQIDHEYLEDDFIDTYNNESKKNLNQLWKSLKEFHLNNQIIEDYDDEVKNVVHILFPKITKIEKHQPIQNDDVIRKVSEEISTAKHHHKNKKEKIHQVYNPTYLPNSLSFQILGGYSMKDKINRWILDTLTSSLSSFKNDQDFERILSLFKKQTYENGEQYFIQEKDWKLDLINIPQGDQSVRQLPYFKDFVPDKEGEIFIKTLFISLDGLIACLANQNSLPCQSPFPHMCFYYKNIKSKDSLDIVSQTILQNQQLKSAYKDGFLQKTSNNNIIVKEEIRYRGKNYKIYVLSLKDGITINGLSTDKL